MDIRLSYIDANPDILDLLQNAKFALEGVSKVAEAVLGTVACVDGFACTPTSPASLSVNIGAGQIYQQGSLISNQISSLVSDTHVVMKQGFLRDALSLTLVPPPTPGFAQNVLIQAQYSDDDTSKTQVFNYYNSSNPDVPLTGPGGNNQAQTVVHAGVAQVTTKYGVAATSGSQVTPPPDAGFVGLYVVTMSFGQSAITAGNIALYPNAPFIGTKLTQIPAYIRAGQVQRSITSALYYVRPDGNDSNDGSTNDPAHAFATIAGALTATANIVTTNGQLMLKLGIPGTYAAPNNINRPGANLAIVGDASNQAGYIIAGAGAAGVQPISAFGCALALTGVTVQNTGTLVDSVAAASNATITLQNVTMLAAPSNNNYHLAAYGTGSIIVGPGVIFASSMGGWLILGGGSITLQNNPITFQNTPAWSGAGVNCTVGGYLNHLGATISGSATGSRYFVTLNGVINTYGSGVNLYPGSTAGVADTTNGGRYV